MNILGPRHEWITVAGFLLATLAVLLLGGAGYYATDRSAHATTWVNHTYEVRQSLARIRSDLIEARNGLRDGAAAELQDEIDRVRTLVADSPGQQDRVGQLRAALARNEPTARVRGILDGLEAEEQRLLDVRTADEQAVQSGFRIVVTLFVLVLILALAVAYRLVTRRRAQEEALRRSEERFHLLTQSVVDYAILLLDPEGRIASWNRGAERIKGWTPEEILGRHFSRFYPAADVEAGKPAAELEVAAAQGRFEEEGWRLRKDGTRFWASVVITAIRDASGALVGYGKVTRDLTERKRAEDELRAEVAQRRGVEEELSRVNRALEDIVAERTRDLRAANAELVAAKGRLQDLSTRLISAQEDERRRISRELHDETGQALTGIRLRLKDAMGHDGHRARLEECVAIVDQAVAHIRNLAVSLRPPMLDDLGLADALEWALDQQAKAAGWRSSLEADTTPVIDPDVQTACFRIGQEALTNAARHAEASEVHVMLRVGSGRLELDVVDNGRGFDLEEFISPQERRKHFGLVSMNERAVLVGGSVEIDSVPGQGTRVRAVFPLPMAC